MTAKKGMAFYTSVDKYSMGKQILALKKDKADLIEECTRLRQHIRTLEARISSLEENINDRRRWSRIS